jgi:hypothetical protein
VSGGTRPGRVGLAVLLVVWAGAAEAQPSPEAAARPVRATFGGDARLRTEAWRNRDGVTDEDDTRALLRLVARTDVAIGRHARVLLEGRSVLAWDQAPGGARASDVDAFDLWHAYLDLTTAPGGGGVRVRVGRQELGFGAQRLVGPGGWSNTRRIFEGVRATVAATDGGWTVDGFWTRPVRVRKYAFNPGLTGGRLAGAYATAAAGPARLDGYLLSTRRTGASGADGPSRWTAGTRVEAGGRVGPSVEGEAAWQSGRGVRSAMVSVTPRYRWPGPHAAYVGIGYDHARGDADPDDGRAEAFDPLFASGHGQLGYADLVGRRNIRAMHVPIGFVPVPGRVSVDVDLHWFRLATAADALYATGGAPTRRSAGGPDVGAEQDITVGVQAPGDAILTLGVHRVVPGEVFGPARTPIYQVYAQLERDF